MAAKSQSPVRIGRACSAIDDRARDASSIGHHLSEGQKVSLPLNYDGALRPHPLYR